MASFDAHAAPHFKNSVQRANSVRCTDFAHCWPDVLPDESLQEGVSIRDSHSFKWRQRVFRSGKTGITALASVQDRVIRDSEPPIKDVHFVAPRQSIRVNRMHAHCGHQTPAPKSDRARIVRVGVRELRLCFSRCRCRRDDCFTRKEYVQDGKQEGVCVCVNRLTRAWTGYTYK